MNIGRGIKMKGLALVTLLTGMVALAASVEETTRFELNIPQGTLSGQMETSVGGRDIYSFRNIPFAEPPTGSLRFEDPKPAGPWTGVRDATVLPPECMYLHTLAYRRDGKLYGQEDCLYLNVYTPQPNITAGLPVMFYIHGGAFYAGSSQAYTPGVLLEEDVILVVVQYRLGTLGFLSTEDSVIPGNFGLKDQTQALRWVHQNIAFFGGDPNRVTLFGNSAGGASVHYHMLVPEAKGLFKYAILQSGNAFCPWAFETSHRKDALKIAQDLHCQVQDENSEEVLECLRQASAEELVYADHGFRTTLWNPVVMAPRVDGTYLPERPEILMMTGKYNAVPIISGVTSHEGAFSTMFFYEDKSRIKDFLENFEVLAPDSFDLSKGDLHPEQQCYEAFSHYLGSVRVDHETASQLTMMYGDAMFVIPHDIMTKLHMDRGTIYAYELEHRAALSWSDNLVDYYSKDWVVHADELMYLFHMDEVLPITTPDDKKVRHLIAKLWTNFAKTGNPTPDTSLNFTWKPSSSSALEHLHITTEPSMQVDDRSKRRDFWMSLPTARNLLLNPHNVKKFEREDQDIKPSRFQESNEEL